MINYEIVIDRRVHIGGLDYALRGALGEAIIGVSVIGEERVIVHFVDEPVGDETATVEAIVSDHDPVFLRTDRNQIEAGGEDYATVTIEAPATAAADVVLIISGSGGDVVTLPVTLVNGLGSCEVDSLDVQTITISVQDGADRTSDELTIRAV